MTTKTKLIIGGVAVVVVYLFYRNSKSGTPTSSVSTPTGTENQVGGGGGPTYQAENPNAGGNPALGVGNQGSASAFALGKKVFVDAQGKLFSLGKKGVLLPVANSASLANRGGRN